MERVVFDRMAAHDRNHWWFAARRDILHDLIVRSVPLPPRPRILEVGCGTGHNFDMLGHFGQIDALEIDHAAREMAQIRLGRRVGDAPLPALPGVASGAYHLVALLDVLEHVADDRAALGGIARVLAPGGRVLLTVPANPWMWSAHDEAHHHHRRYTAATLREAAVDAGFRVELLSHFNSLLFPLIAGARVAGKLTGREAGDDGMPSAPVNGALRTIFRAERHLVGRVPLPAGVSLVAILSLDAEQHARPPAP